MIAEFSVQVRKEPMTGYQGKIYEQNKTYVVCNCGWEEEGVTMTSTLVLAHRIDHLEGRI